MEKCIEAAAIKWLSVSAPYLAHYLRGNLAEEASCASLDSIEVRRGGLNCVFSFPYITCFSRERHRINLCAMTDLMQMS